MEGRIHQVEWPTGNTYIIEEQGRFAIVDPGYPRYWSRIEQFLLGLPGGSPSRVSLIVVTHDHPDHCGGVDRAMRHCPSAILAAHPRAADHGIDQMPRLTLHHLAIAGEILIGMAKAGFPLPKSRYRAPVTIPLKDGETLPAPFDRWCALHTPGHVSAHLSLYREAGGRLICGDVLVNTAGRPHPTGLVSDPAAMAQTLTRLRDLRIDSLYPGHGRPVLDRAHAQIQWA